MNYAEDRLDRRARYQAETRDSTCNTDAAASDEKPPSMLSLSASPIASDLRKAHSILHAAGESFSETIIDDHLDLQSHAVKETLFQLRTGHELAGRSLRDCGKCRHATYHYSLAWMCDPTNYQCAGDYAQMADLAGIPEVGVLSLLYYRNGGNLDWKLPLMTAREASIRANDDSNTADDETKAFFTDGTSLQNCGCFHSECGASICTVAMPTVSLLLRQILKDLERILDDTSVDEEPTTAASVLEGLSKAAQAEKRRRKAEASNSSTIAPTATHSFVPWQGGICSSLQFWNEIDSNSDGRAFPPLLQILLLKLLYASPVGGPFLKLACVAIPHLALKMPLSSALGRQMARDYKSHWAYYILIRAVVLGERVKLHRRGTAVPYHVPVWDIVHGLDRRHSLKLGGCCRGGNESSFSTRLLQLFDECCSHFSEDGISGASPLRLQPVCLPPSASHPPLYILGDSHVLSIAWQTLDLKGELRILVPFLATGMKAWHIREGTLFFTHYNLQMCLQRLPARTKSTLLSAGEIDCREGIGGEKLRGYYASCEDAVRKTVREYVSAVAKLAARRKLQILLLPVAPHAYRSEKNGKAAGRGLRRERMLLWNDSLREEVVRYSTARCGVHLLDYEKHLRSPDGSSPVGFVLNKAYNADYTHMNSAFLPHMERSFFGCVAGSEGASSCNVNLV